MQSELTGNALQSVIQNLMNLKQQFELTKIFKMNL